jgi:predicted GIY-YIG superfamily endonuclease
MTTIYTLELENGKYYIGRSNTPKQRILNHFQEHGSDWTKLHKPINVLIKVKGDEFDEEKHTLIAMEKYGIDNVRGGSYCKIQLTQHDKDKALQTIRSITDKCYKCGEKGHFIKDCGKLQSNSKNKLYPVSINSSENTDEELIELCKLGYSYFIKELSETYGNIYTNNDKLTSFLKQVYLNYVKKCKGNCNKCNNYRMYYLYTNIKHMLFASCNKCYTGKNDDIFCIDDELMFYHQYAFENEELKTNICIRLVFGNIEKHPKYNDIQKELPTRNDSIRFIMDLSNEIKY